MEKEFVPYELAVKLKDLGFKKTCLAEYIDGTFYLSTSLNNKKKVRTIASAPLWQQAFDWFREKYNLLITISGTGNKDINTINKISFWFQYKIEGINEKGLSSSVDYINPIYGVFKTYEEAREACLEKLIELCQQN